MFMILLHLFLTWITRGKWLLILLGWYGLMFMMPLIKGFCLSYIMDAVKQLNDIWAYMPFYFCAEITWAIMKEY